jgi:solute carrier family 6 amino acid transporter-like protein 5/7/9/14
MIWQLVIALFVSYVIVYAMLIRGIKVSGKLVYFTSLFPYVVLFILGVRGWMLPGAEIGIKFYILPQWEKLADIKVWSDAASRFLFLFLKLFNKTLNDHDL